MKRKQIIQILMLVVLLSYMICCEVDCWAVHNPHGPNPPEPEPVEYHDYWLKYVITEDMIKNHNIGADYRTAEVVFNYNLAQAEKIRLEKSNKYLFIGELNQVPCHEKHDNRKVHIFIFDSRRVAPGADWHITFGDIFILEEKNTGIETQLTKVVNNTYPRCKGEMAETQIFHDGSVEGLQLNVHVQ